MLVWPVQVQRLEDHDTCLVWYLQSSFAFHSFPDEDVVLGFSIRSYAKPHA